MAGKRTQAAPPTTSAGHASSAARSGAPRARRRLEPARVVGQLRQQLGQERLDLGAPQEREERARGGGLLGVAGDLDPQRREPERPPQHALDHAHGVHAPHRQRHLGALQQPAPDPQPLAVARDREARERHQRPRHRDRPRRQDQAAERELPAAERVGRQPRRLLDAPLVLEDVGEELEGDRQHRQDHAELAGGERRDQPVAAAQPPLGQRRPPERPRRPRAAARAPPRAAARPPPRRPRRARSRPWRRRPRSARSPPRRRTAAGPARPRCRGPGCGRAAPSSASCARSRSASARRARRPRSSCSASA